MGAIYYIKNVKKMLPHLQIHAIAQVLADVFRFDRLGQTFLRVAQGRDLVEQRRTGLFAARTRILERMRKGVVKAQLVVPGDDQLVLVGKFLYGARTQLEPRQHFQDRVSN